MFEMLRKMIIPIIVIVLAFFLGMIVLQWGMDFTGRQKNAEMQNYAGKINDEEIPWQTWQNIYNSMYQNEAKSSDYDVDDDRVRELETQAWQEVVNDRLLMQQARKYNITVSDGEVYAYLRYNPPTYLRTAPAFQDSTGQFDYQRYMAALAEPQFAPFWNQLEPQIRADITKLKLQQMIIQTAQVSDGEVRQAYIDKYDSIKVASANAQSTRYTARFGNPTDEETRAYYDEHKDKYKIGPRVVMKVIKAVKEPSELDKEQAKARIWAIYDTVKAGGDFAEYARIYSEDPASGPRGGDLGWFAKNRMVHAFDSTVWSMKEGEISIPVKTSFGWHIIRNNGFRKVEDDKATGKNKPMIDEVSAQHILIKEEPSEETLEALWQRIETVKTQAEEVGFEEAAKAEDFEVFTTEPTAKNGAIAYLNGAPEVIEWGLNAKVGAISEGMDLGELFCLAEVEQKLPAGVAEFANVKERAAQDLIRDESLNVCLDTMNLVAQDVKNGAKLKDAAKKYGISYDTLATFSRDGRVGTVASDQTAIGTAFALKSVGDVSDPVEYSSGVVMFQLLDRVPTDMSHYDEVRDSVYSALLQFKQRSVFTAWFTDLRDKAVIESNVTSLHRRQ